MKNKFKLLLFTILTLLIFTGTTYAATPPANAEIGNQATLEYVDGTGEARTVLSNIVITRVNPVYGIKITPDNSLTSLTGETVIFVHTVENLGNTTDTFKAAIQNTVPGLTDVQILIPGAAGLEPFPANGIEYEPGAQVTILVSALVTGNPDDVLGDLTIRATSQKNNALYSEALDTVTVSEGAVINVYKSFDERTGTTDQIITTTLYGVNTGNPLEAGSNLVITDTLDDEFVYIEGNVRYSMDAGSTWNSIQENTVGLNGVRIDQTGQDITITVANGIPQQSGSQTLEEANFQIEFTIQPVPGYARTIPNVASYTYNDGSVDVPSQNTNKVSYVILQLADLTFVGEELDTVEQGALFFFKNTITNTGNGPDAFDITLVQNEFPAGTDFFLSFDTEGDDSFDARVPLIDTTSSGYVDTGIMDPGEIKHILLWVQLPREAVGADLKISKFGESNYDMTNENEVIASATAEDIVRTVNPADVDLTNNYSLTDRPNASDIGKGKGPEVAPVTEIDILPGNTGYFNLYVNNISGFVTDDYTLEVSTDPEFNELSLPDGIDVSFVTPQGAELKTTGPVEPGNFFNVRANVSVKANTLAGNISLYFRARSLTTGAVDIKHDMVKIGILRNLSILPNNAGETYAGSSIYYTHTITNGGNVTEGGGSDSSIALIKLSDSLGGKFSSTTWLDVDGNGVLEKGVDKQINDLATIDGLAPGTSIQVFVEVTAALNAVEGSSNTTNIRLDVTKGVYNVFHPDVKAEDVTTIIADSIVIEKFQGTSDQTTNQANFTKDPQQGTAGGYIYYRILVTNTGSQLVEDVVVEDIIPQYTTMAYGGNPDGNAGVDTKPSWRVGTGAFSNAETIPALGTKGIIKATIGDLDAGETAELYFNVLIDGQSVAN